MAKEQEEYQEEDDAMTSNSSKGKLGAGQRKTFIEDNYSTMEKPIEGVLPAVEGHILGKRYNANFVNLRSML